MRLAWAQWEAPCALSEISHARDLHAPSANMETGLGVRVCMVSVAGPNQWGCHDQRKQFWAVRT